jgi:hypothetical protein
LVNQRPEPDSLKDGSTLALGRVLEGIEIRHVRSTIGEEDRVLGHGDDALAESRAVDFVERRVIDDDILGARRKRVQQTEEKENH